MPLPFDLLADFLATRDDDLRDVLYRPFLAESDGGQPEHGPPEPVKGVRGEAAPVSEVSVGDGFAAIDRATWTVVREAGRPLLRSLIVDGADVWVVESSGPDPASGTVHTCNCTLA